MKITTLAKIIFTVLLVAFLVFKINLAEIAAVFSSLNIIFFIGGFCCVPLLYAVRTYKWKLLLEGLQVHRGFAYLYKVLFIGAFYGLITPGKIGELGRAYHLDEKKALTLPTVVIEKINDILVLLFLSFLTLVLFLHSDRFFMTLTFAGTVIFLFGIWILTNQRVLLFVAGIFHIDKNHLDLFIDTIKTLVHNRRLMVSITIVSLIYYLVVYLIGLFLAQAMGIEWMVIITIPLIILIGNIPLTIAGLGLRESVAALCFILLGYDGSLGFSYSLLLFIITTLIPGLAGYFLSLKIKTIYT